MDDLLTNTKSIANNFRFLNRIFDNIDLGTFDKQKL